MKLTILLFLVGVCIVTAKYLPNEWDNSGQSLSRYKRSDSDESDGSSEDENDSNNNNDDGDLQNHDEKDEQSKRIEKIEKMRQKLIEKQEKERKKQEEIQRKIEEKIAKELERQEEKRQKEKRKQEEKLEKERQKLEEEQKKIQEKILENERKRQEIIQKELEETEKNARKIQESAEPYAENSIKEFFKIQIYSKYGINESNTNFDKKEALTRYLQEELGLNTNSTESERRKAIFDLVQNKLQNASEINALQNQIIEYIKFEGVQKIRAKIEKDIEKLQNQTETLNNVNSTWVPSAKQNIAEQVSFLESIKQILPNVWPSWFSNSQPQVKISLSPNVDNKNLTNFFKISHDSNNVVKESNSVNTSTDKAADNLNSISLSNSDLGEVTIINEVTSNSVNNPNTISDNGASSIFSSSVITEPLYTNHELEQNTDVSSNDFNISDIVSVGITTENAQNPLINIIASSLNSADGVEPSSLLPSSQSTKVSILSGNNNESLDSQNNSQFGEVNPSLTPRNNNNSSENQYIDRPNNSDTLSTISVDVTNGNVPLPIIDTIPSLISARDVNSSSVVFSPDLRNETSSLLSIINEESNASQDINSSPNIPSVLNSLPVDTTTEFVSNLILNIDLSVNSVDNKSSISSNPKVPQVNSSFVVENNNKLSDNQDIDGLNNVNPLNTNFVVATSENLPVLIVDTTPSVTLAEDSNSSSILSSPDLTNETSSLLYRINNEIIYDNSNINSSSNNSSVPNLLPVEVTTEFVSNLILDSVLSVNSAGNSSFFSSNNNNLSSDSQNIDKTNISIISIVATTENIPNSVIDIILSENSTADNSTSDFVSGNNTSLPGNQNITDSLKNVSNIVDVTTEFVPSQVENVTSINLVNSANLSSSSPNLGLSEDVPNVGFNINTESPNNTLKEVIVSVGEVLDIKNDVQQNVSSKVDNNNTNSESSLQSINVRVEATNQTISPNEPVTDNGGMFNTEQQVTFNEVTSLSTEQSVVAETTLQDVSTGETILINTEAIPINAVPEEPGALIVDVVKQ